MSKAKKNPAAVRLGKLSVRGLSPEQLRARARKAAKARWAKRRK